MKEHNSLVEFVKSQIAFHERLAEQHSKVPKRAEKHLETAGNLRKLLNYIDELIEGATALRPLKAKPMALGVSFDELESLPPELVQELSVSDGDRTDFTILKIVEAVGGIASLDRILIGLYRETGEVMKRSTLTSRVYRMTQKNLLFPVPNRKGVYSIQEISEEDANKLLS